jgi:hypothetical protein
MISRVRPPPLRDKLNSFKATTRIMVISGYKVYEGRRKDRGSQDNGLMQHSRETLVYNNLIYILFKKTRRI